MSEDRELRNVLEQTQAELRQARERLKVLEQTSTEALEDRIDELEAHNAAMRIQLEQGDAHRESAAHRQASLERELAIARTDQQRLQSQLETLNLERRLGRDSGRTMRDIVVGFSIAIGGALALVLLIRLLA